MGQSKTRIVIAFIRLFPIGGDVDKAIQSANDVKIYPLAKAGQPRPSWENNMEYFRQLHAVIQIETNPATKRGHTLMEGRTTSPAAFDGSWKLNNIVEMK